MLYKREWLWKRNYIFSFVKHVRRPNYILKLFGSSHTLEVPKLGFDVVCLEVPKLRFDVICLIVLPWMPEVFSLANGEERQSE